MDDEKLGRGIINVWHTEGSHAAVGAAARAALTEPEVTREDVEKWIKAVGWCDGSRDGEINNILAALRHFARAPIPTSHDIAEAANARAALAGPVPTREEVEAFCDKFDCRGSKTYAEIVLAALRHFARAPGGAVPSVEEIEAEMERDRKTIMSGDWPVPHCARVAHAMMQRIGARGEMMIDGMTEDQIARALFAEKQGPLSIDLQQIIADCAHTCYRLATTPRPVDDPDKEAKAALAGLKRGPLPSLPDWDHAADNLKESIRILVRAVAKGKADE